MLLPQRKLFAIQDLGVYGSNKLTPDNKVLANIDGGVGDYCWRPLCMAYGGAVVNAEPTSRLLYLHMLDLNRQGFGVPAQCVYAVGDTDLYRGILNSPVARTALEAHLADGGLVEFFRRTERSRVFIRKLGIPESQIYNAELGMVRRLNKVAIRRMAENMGCAHVFPRYRIGLTHEEIRNGADDLFRQGCERLLVKRPQLASGAGFFNGLTRENLMSPEFRAYLNEWAPEKFGVQLIVEEYWGHEDISAVFEFYNGQAELVYVTGQIMEPDGITHAGNYIGMMPEDVLDVGLNGVREKTVRVLRHVTGPLVGKLIAMGYKGRLCMDLRINSDGDVKLLEFNPRPSASNYPHSMLIQAIRNHGLQRAGVTMVNVYPRFETGFDQVLDRLGLRRFNTDVGYGAMALNVACLQHQRSKFALCVIAPTVIDSRVWARTIKADFERQECQTAFQVPRQRPAVRRASK